MGMDKKELGNARCKLVHGLGNSHWAAGSAPWDGRWAGDSENLTVGHGTSEEGRWDIQGSSLE